jgi:hypothetical protein
VQALIVLPGSILQCRLALHTAVADNPQLGEDACLKQARLLARCHAMADGMSLRKSAKESAISTSIVFTIFKLLSKET